MHVKECRERAMGGVEAQHRPEDQACTCRTARPFACTPPAWQRWQQAPRCNNHHGTSVSIQRWPVALAHLPEVGKGEENGGEEQ